MRSMTLLFLALSLLPLFSQAKSAREDSIEHYQLRYGLRNVFDKRVDNYGNGYEGLYGVRNFRVVLNGAVYRGGANNACNRNGKRHNSNPLPNEGLKNLCEEGFDRAIYLYPTRFRNSPKAVSCQSSYAGSNTLEYDQKSVLGESTAAKEILELVYARLTNPGHNSPVYLHCWNGWHASGYISALILRQFCDYSGEQAVSYWDRNTDGMNRERAYEKIRAKLRAFKPLPELKISRELKDQVCL